ncbi:hypothetical protein ABQF34_17035 [Mycolicibacterium boenickei]
MPASWRSMIPASTRSCRCRINARRWDRLHWVRVGLLAVVFVLVAVASGR